MAFEVLVHKGTVPLSPLYLWNTVKCSVAVKCSVNIKCSVTIKCLSRKVFYSVAFFAYCIEHFMKHIWKWSCLRETTCIMAVCIPLGIMHCCLLINAPGLFVSVSRRSDWSFMGRYLYLVLVWKPRDTMRWTGRWDALVVVIWLKRTPHPPCTNKYTNLL